MEQPTVSVAMITYQQQAYIGQALDSVLMQRGIDHLEIVVGEDASQDRTREILLDYQKRYPQKLRLLLREENMGATRNFYDVLSQCRGRYIALLEGDDFWTDPCKLTKQVRLLEKHPEYIGCAHQCVFVGKDGTPLPGISVNEWFYQGDVYTFQNFQAREMPGQTGTLLFRNIFLQPKYDYQILYSAHPVIGDRTLFMLLAHQGEIYCIKQVMGCYRLVREAGAQNWVAHTEHVNVLDSSYRYLCALEEYARHELGRPLCFQEAKDRFYGQAFCKLLRHPSKKNLRVLTDILHQSGGPVRQFMAGLRYAAHVVFHSVKGKGEEDR